MFEDLERFFRLKPSRARCMNVSFVLALKSYKQLIPGSSAFPIKLFKNQIWNEWTGDLP